MSATTLSKADISNAKQGIYDCRLALQEIDKIEACGLDCRERRERCESLLNFLTAVLTQYSPNNLPPAN